MGSFLDMYLSRNSTYKLFLLVIEKMWTHERNRLNVNMIVAQICTKVNFSMTCSESKPFVTNNSQLIKASKSNTKYKFNVLA